MFLEGWLVRQEHYLDELTTTTESNIYEKHDSVLRARFNRTCSSSLPALEKSFLWITGFRPCLAIKFVKNSVNDLSEEQLEKLEKLKLEIKEEEKELDEDLIGIQESLAAPPFSEITTLYRIPVKCTRTMFSHHCSSLFLVLRINFDLFHRVHIF
ncbi:hypothetical protein MKW98_024447 [Papaver atlanticum]|uniref:DOG1 domain-containing protein n=1 Tax=Papaver atlanticum TaxID=357466 RepID=A0AAD4T144_9MAGN|nr:hypothetical protein MKW98_024447 [Papaver atlanticum]